MSVNGGGPAFPVTMSTPEGGVFQSPGMSLRDWFAGQALPSFLNALLAGNIAPMDGEDGKDMAVRCAYEAADAMLAARAKAAA